MKFRDRVKELRRVRASELKPHPKNWRTHSRFQQDVWRGLLNEIGVAGAVLARELPDGSLQLIDGHLRAATTPSATLPVLVLDLDDTEAEKLLLTHDPLGSLAGVDEKRLAGLLEGARADTVAVDELLEKLRGATDSELPAQLPPEVEIHPSYQVVIEVETEPQQREIYERMRKEGYRCRVLTL